MNRLVLRGLTTVCIVVVGLLGILGTGSVPITPIVTEVGLSVGTVSKTSGLVDSSTNCSPPPTPPAPNIQAWWNSLPPDNHRYPYVGFELWRNTNAGCTSSRIDAYRAFVTFNMASVSNLKGLVTKAQLIISTRALPGGVTAGNPSCIARTGGAGALVRFGPAASGLPPITPQGALTQFGSSEQFPIGNLVFEFPMPWVSGAVVGAALPTTTTANLSGGADFVVDVTSQVVGTLNGGFPGMSWMLSSAFEGPLTGPASSGLDCKTSYGFSLRLTHL